MRTQSPQEVAASVRDAQLCFKLNHTMPYTDEYNAILQELFGGRLCAGSVVTKDVPDNCIAVGSPARVIKQIKPIEK